ncbi:ankyrin repeat domain-containing protein 13C-B-like [Clavelina lepadiformis]|uniref:Ankyrin repeat domain-containing protein n=1 Tax=Clavelina lepadiformis TaxID=159417 RepID=A0ABP0GCP7_CLALP
MTNNSLLRAKGCPLHELVFKNDISGVSKLINQHKLDEEVGLEKLQDHHGNTPLHLAVMLGHKECVQILLKHGHAVNIKNNAGWTALQEAVSYGDRQTITSLFRSLRKEHKKTMRDQKPEIRQALQSFGEDFYIEMKWDFQSWIPFVSRILPSDTCHIYRSGFRFRMDSTLEDFSDRRWVRGDITFIVNFDTEGEPAMFLLDNKNKVYQCMQKQTPQEKEASIEDEVDIAMSTDVVDGSMKTKQTSIERVTTGWIFRQEKSEKIGQFDADFYRIYGLKLVTRKRREHLSEEDIKKNKSLRDALSQAETAENALNELADTENPVRRTSLPPPDRTNFQWNEYYSSAPGNPPCLGRKVKEKTNTKSFEAVVAMSEKFPIRLENLLPILEALGPKAKIFTKLRDFISVHLPPGFPVRIDIPIFPTIKATVNFTQFEFRNSIPDSMFTVPTGYREVPGWFEKTSKARQTETGNISHS